MAFNYLWGVGREPRVLNTVNTTTVEGSVGFGNNAGATTLTDTGTLSSLGPIRVIGFYVTITPINGNSGSQGVNPRSAIYLNGNLIAQFNLPVKSNPTEQGGEWSIQEFIQGGQESTGANNALNMVSDVDSTNAGGYTIRRKVVCVYVDI